MYPAVLIVDDEKKIIESLEGILSDDGFEVMHAFNGFEALKKIEKESPDIILLDIWMPGMDGLETLKAVKKLFPSLPVIMITGHGCIESAVDAIKAGAFDFLEKPLSIDKVMITINNALNFRKLEEENKYLRKKTIEKNSLTGTSQAVKKLYKDINKAAFSDTAIFIKGENGTGKELVAKSIHQLSQRHEYPFIIIDCATIPDKYIESELFGHEKGAFKGASSKNKGKFELALQGTLFLDEIGNMNLETQSKILRAIESKTFQRIGGGRTIHMDVRIIASTNKNIENEIKNKNFREDLFYRLNVIPVKVPPLRDRREDIPMLIECFLQEFSNHPSNGSKQMSKEAVDILTICDWNGNVRELKNLIERLCIMVDKKIIEAKDLPSYYNNNIQEQYKEEVKEIFQIDNFETAKKAFTEEFFKNKIEQANGDIKLVSLNTGIKLKDLSQIIKKKTIKK